MLSNEVFYFIDNFVLLRYALLSNRKSLLSHCPKVYAKYFYTEVQMEH